MAGNATGFNDLATDAKGRIYVGSLAYSWCLGGEDRDAAGSQPLPHRSRRHGGARGRRRRAARPTASASRRTAGCSIIATPVRELVRVYDVGATTARSATGAPSPPPGPGSVPDGLKVAVDGSVWVADAHGGRGRRVREPMERHRRDIQVPRPMVTSLCFGGDDLKRPLHRHRLARRPEQRVAARSIACAATWRACRCPLARVSAC